MQRRGYNATKFTPKHKLKQGHFEVNPKPVKAYWYLKTFTLNTHCDYIPGSCTGLSKETRH